MTFVGRITECKWANNKKRCPCSSSCICDVDHVEMSEEREIQLRKDLQRWVRRQLQQL